MATNNLEPGQTARLHASSALNWWQEGFYNENIWLQQVKG
jgi:hypothetical protein